MCTSYSQKLLSKPTPNKKHSRWHTASLPHSTELSFPPYNFKRDIYVGEWGGEVEGSRLEAWTKSHKSEVAII